MNKRLQQFLQAENISQSQFADTVGITRAGVSHILSGRNKPGYEFLLNLTKYYPALNIEWLISGKGKMYKTEEPRYPASMAVLPFPAEVSAEEVAAEDAVAGEKPSREPENEGIAAADTPAVQRKVRKIIVLYDDSTFEEFSR